MLAFMILRQLRNAESSSFTYVVGDKKYLRAVIIDPVTAHVGRDLRLVRDLGLTPEYVLLTHCAPDLEQAARIIRGQTGARIASGNGATKNTDLIVKGGNVLKFGGHEVRVLATPGAAAGSVSYLVGQRVFTGSVLSVRACGHGYSAVDPNELFDSVVNVLFALPDEIIVYPTHDEGGVAMTTIGAERRFNPALAARDRAAFIARCAESAPQ